MDPKRVKYSPATFLSLERQYLSSLVQGRYSDILPVSYRGQPLTLWGQFQSSFPAPSSVQMRVDEGRILRSRSMLNAPSVYICGCDLCEATTNREVTYFHSIMDEMLLMPTRNRDVLRRMCHQFCLILCTLRWQLLKESSMYTRITR